MLLVPGEVAQISLQLWARSVRKTLAKEADWRCQGASGPNIDLRQLPDDVRRPRVGWIVAGRSGAPNTLYLGCCR